MGRWVSILVMFATIGAAAVTGLVS